MDSLGACHLRLRGYTFEALPDAVQAKGAAKNAPAFPLIFILVSLWQSLLAHCKHTVHDQGCTLLPIMFWVRGIPVGSKSACRHWFS